MKTRTKTLVIIAIFLIVAIWWHEKNVIPEVSIPTAEMPSPNGFDILTKVANRQKDSDKISNALRQVPTDKVQVESINGKNVPVKVYSYEERAFFVSENKKVLSDFRAALPYEYKTPPTRSMMTLFPYISKYRALSRLIDLNSQVEARHKNWAAAVNSSLDGIEFGTKMPRGGGVIHGLVGIALQRIDRENVWGYIDYLTESEAKAAGERLEGIIDEQVPFSETLMEEKWAMQASIIELMKKKEFTQTLLDGSHSILQDRSWIEAIYSVALLNLTSNRTIMRRYTQHMDMMIEASKYPCGDKRRQYAEPDIKNIVDSVLLPSYKKAEFKWTANETQNQMLLVALALQAYKRKYQQYPNSLSALAPELPEIPFDSFGKDTFLYKKTEQKYLLYSVGPDIKDDGGQAVKDIRGGRPNVANMDSKGDIVAGINRI